MRATTVLEYARLLTRKLGSEMEPEIPGEYRLGDNRHSVSSIEKLKRLGWEPRKGLEEIFDDYLESPDARDGGCAEGRWLIAP